MQKENIFYFSQDYNNKTDEQLVVLVKEGNEEALSFLLQKYRELVKTKINKYYIVGAEKDDIFQEGMIGLYKAIKSFNNDKQSSFKTFANICIERHLITAIKSSTRQKHIPLNSYLSLNTSAYDNNDESVELIDTFDSHTIEDPLEIMMKKEAYLEINTSIDKSLSDFEKKVLNRFIKGESYVTIAKRLDSPVKSVDNAMQRIRKKAIKTMFSE